MKVQQRKEKKQAKTVRAEVATAKRKEKQVAMEMRAEKRRREGTSNLALVTKVRPTRMSVAFNPYQQLLYPYQYMFCPPMFQYPLPSIRCVCGLLEGCEFSNLRTGQN